MGDIDPPSNEELIEVYRAFNPAEAHIILLALEDEGIKAVSAEEETNVALPIWPLQTRILVNKSSSSRATEILRQLEKKLAENRKQDGNL